MQVHELMDACIFAVSFWLAYVLRSDPRVIDFFRLDDVSPFEAYVWLYLILIPAAPLILEAQGFYNRPILCSRITTAWLLFKGCLFTTLGLILALFLFHSGIARLVTVFFGGISFILLFSKEELLRRAVRDGMHPRGAEQPAERSTEIHVVIDHGDVEHYGFTHAKHPSPVSTLSISGEADYCP
jgi:FlaA1/EpsC-like NDP-sugar epimerase